MSVDGAGKDKAIDVKQAAAARSDAARKSAGMHARLVLSDLGSALRSDWKAQLLLLFLVLAIIGWDMPIVSTLLYPFKLFVTMIHESCHALMARFTGGGVASISISPDESGLTQSLGGNQFLVASAGYPGTAIVGALFIWWGRLPKNAPFILQTLGTVMLCMTIFYGGGGIFSFISMLVISLMVLFVARRSSEKFCHMFLLFLGVITAIQSLLCIQTILVASIFSLPLTVPNDAEGVAKMTGIPAVMWELAWGALSIVALFLATWLGYRPTKGQSGLGASSTQSIAVGETIEPLAIEDKSKIDKGWSLKFGAKKERQKR